MSRADCGKHRKGDNSVFKAVCFKYLFYVHFVGDSLGDGGSLRGRDAEVTRLEDTGPWLVL